MSRLSSNLLSLQCETLDYLRNVRLRSSRASPSFLEIIYYFQAADESNLPKSSFLTLCSSKISPELFLEAHYFSRAPFCLSAHFFSFNEL